MNSRLGVLVACCLATIVAVSPAVALGQGPPDSPSELSGALLLPDSPVASEQTQAAREATLASPEAVAAREASRTRYKNEDRAQAAQTIGEAFPSVVDHQDGPPPLAVGEKSLGFKSANVEQIETGSGYVGVVQSTAPIALPTGGGHWAGVNLSLREAGGGFEAQNPLTSVRLPKHLPEGAQLPQVGLSLTPVDEAGTPLSGSEGVTDGSGVLFANTQTDADTLLQPSLFGVDANTVLRSTASPEVLDYKVGLPQGARLVAPSDGPGAEVLKEGVVLARIKPPVASDAAGTPVPTSMSVSGDTIVVSVEHGKGSYHYPIMVDPEFWQVWMNYPTGNWEFHERIGYRYGRNNSEIWMSHEGTYSPEDYAAWSTWTKGKTQIYEVYVKDDVTPSEPFLGAWIEIFGPGEREYTILSHPPSDATEATVCARASCTPESGIDNGNHFGFELTTNLAGSSGFWGSLTQVSMAIGEEKGLHSTVAYSRSIPELTVGSPPQKASNVLYSGAGGRWIGPKYGAFEFTAADEGLGIAETNVEYHSSSGWERFGGTNYQSESGNFLSKSGCIGVQCESPQSAANTYLSLKNGIGKYLPDGEDKIRVVARSPEPYTSSDEYGEGEETLKVDATPPHNITVSGLTSGPEGFELGEVEAHIKAEASDGSGTTKSSGMKSIALYVDGREAGNAAGSCSIGPCTASAAWSLNGSELGVGEHSLVVKATDNAGNEATSATYKLVVHSASPVGIGPGSVNPESGDFALEATDVKLNGGMGSLTVTRHYDSRGTTQGGQGPFGPQWTVGLGNASQLEPLPDGSVMVTSPSGLTHFSVKVGGGFEAPAGDANLALEYSKEYEGRGPAYLLKNATRGTETIFRRPEGAEAWLASISKGPIATDTITDEYRIVEGEGQKIAEPTLELSPHPSLTCEKEHMAVGCRGLEFLYTEGAGTAKGETQSEWGSFKNRLKEIKAVVANPTSKAIERIPVAAYEYDGKGRLRSEWDPRVSPALTTVVGYDEQGHLTAVTPPGQTPWLLTYGTAAGDSSPGRLVKAMRPASAASWNGKAPKQASAVSLSGSAVLGSIMSVEHGSWENGALAYGYQWERCGSSCVPIIGATNPEYAVTKSDLADTLRVVVTATNSGGSTTVYASSATILENGTIKNGEHRLPSEGATVEYQVPLSGGGGLPNLTSSEVAKWGQKDIPVEATAIIPPYKPSGWPASEYASASVYYMDAKARTVNTANAFGGIGTQEFNEEDEVTRSLSPDDRAMAFKEANPLEASERLDTKSVYNGGLLTDTWGPQHTVKLASGKKEANEEVQARDHVRYYYDEGAPSGGEKYDLVTKTTDAAETPGKEEFDKRTTLTSYSGQEDLGWRLRKPTSVVTDPGGLDRASTTVYSGETGDVVETQSPGGDSETVYPPVFSSQFGGEGSGNGQFERTGGVAIDASGDDWVADYYNDRVEKFSPSGTFLAAYGTGGSGNGQFYHPLGLAINQSSGSVYVADSQNNRIEELSSSGAFVRSFGTSGEGTLKEPSGVAISANGEELYVADHGDNQIVVFSAEGAFIRKFGSAGSGNGQLSAPNAIVVSEGSVFVVDSGNDRVEQFSSSGAYEGQFGAKGTGSGQFESPSFIAANPSTGVLYVSDTNNHRVEEWSPSGKFLTEWQTWSPSHELDFPYGLAVDSSGKLYVGDEWGDKVSSWLPPEAGGAKLAFGSAFGSAGWEGGHFWGPLGVAVDGEGDVWVTDHGNDRVEKFSPAGSLIASYGSHGYGNGEFDEPTGIDINQATGDVFVSDTGNERIDELSPTGSFITSFGHSGAGKLAHPAGLKVDSAGNVWVADSAEDRIVEFSSTGTFIAAYGEEGSGHGQFKAPMGIAFSGEHAYVADAGNSRVEILSTKGEYINKIAIEGPGSGELYDPEGIASDAAGNLYVVDSSAGHVEEFSASGAYKATYASAGSGEKQLNHPVGVAIAADGDMYVADTEDNRVEHWTNDNPAVHHAQTVYYSAGEEASVTACRKHPEWAGLPCQTNPAAQPNTPGLPELPVMTIAYNMWDEKAVVEERFGSVTRVTTNTFEGNSERPLSTEEKSSVNATMPKVTDKYNIATGDLEEQASTNGEKLVSTTNQLGELATYTDADGNRATLEHDAYGRVTELKDGSEEGRGSQKYAYNATTGARTSLTDSAAGLFGATQDVEGNTTAETFPNGMTAYYTRNSVGAATGIEYKKTSHCTEEKESCVWFKERLTPSIHGEAIKQMSTLAEASNTYNSAGELTQVQETPTGEGCKIYLYNYDEDGNRLSQTEREPATEGKCATEGGSTQAHVYSANRLADPGVIDDAFGDTERLPAVDAGGSELVSTFYVDGQVYKQKQSGETIEYMLDPEDRTRKTTYEGGKPSPVISHYDAPGSAVAWTSEPESKWTRNIPGIEGELAAVETSSMSVVLQLHDLQGNIVATAGISEIETKLLSKYSSSEFGVPTGKGRPPRYAWFGAGELTSEFSSGVITQDGETYVPQTGRELQAEAPDLPLPVNAVNQPSTSGGPEALEHAGVGAALEYEQFLESQRAAGGTDPKCHLRASIGSTVSSTGKEWVYARAWGDCSGAQLPRYSQVQACLVIQPDEAELSPAFVYCSDAGAGFTPPGKSSTEEAQGGSLYAHVHLECEHEVSYQAWAWYWVPGMEFGLTTKTKGWWCESSPLETIGEVGVVLGEAIPPILP